MIYKQKILIFIEQLDNLSKIIFVFVNFILETAQKYKDFDMILGKTHEIRVLKIIGSNFSTNKNLWILENKNQTNL